MLLHIFNMLLWVLIILLAVFIGRALYRHFYKKK